MTDEEKLLHLKAQAFDCGEQRDLWEQKRRLLIEEIRKLITPEPAKEPAAS